MMRQITTFLLTIFLFCSFSIDQVEAVLDKGYAAEDAERFAEAISHYEKALQLLPADSIAWISDINASLLNCHLRVGQIQQALMCGEKSLKLDEKMGDKERIASSLSNLASLLITANRLDVAEKYLLRSVALERELKTEDKLAIRLGMLAEVYTKMKRPEKALPLAKEALELDQKGGREGKAAIRMSQYGNALVCTKHAAEAIPVLTRALNLHQKYGNHVSEAITLATLGMAENDLRHDAKAECHLQKCIEVSQQIGFVQPLMTAHQELSELYNRQRDPRAYTHLVKYSELKDSVASVMVQQQISDLEVKYETRQKEQELKQKEMQIQRQRIIYIALAIMLVMAIAIVVFLVQTLRLKNQNMQFKDRVMQIVSHDLKNPAIAHQKSLHLLVRSVDTLCTDELRDMTASMAQDADAHVNLVYSLLDWAGLQTGRLRYTPISMSLSNVCKEVMAQHRGQASIKGVSLVLNAEESEVAVTADRQMVESMVRNLLCNAIKFSDAGSEIRISIREATLEIDDDGIGMGSNSSEKGTGLGLNLVRRLAKINKATFAIMPKDTGGTLASICFLRTDMQK